MIYWLIIISYAVGGGTDIEKLAIGTQSECHAAQAAIEEQRTFGSSVHTYCVEGLQ